MPATDVLHRARLIAAGLEDRLGLEQVGDQRGDLARPIDERDLALVGGRLGAFTSMMTSGMITAITAGTTSAPMMKPFVSTVDANSRPRSG
jgi:hypothetical protein